jgi:metal-sulfur cluster biosynthetic enzyme
MIIKSEPIQPVITKKITPEVVYERLKTVIDPELSVDIVNLGLIYDVTVSPLQTPEGPRDHIHILMTLTTPGCPLSAVFDTMVRSAVGVLPGIDSDQDISLELTFDPPWVTDMMSEETKAELGFD